MSKQVAYWINSANHDLDVAETLFQSGKYDWCLYIAHLVLEKTLKAFYVKNVGKLPPRIHEFTKENFQRMKEIYKCLLKKIEPSIKQKHL